MEYTITVLLFLLVLAGGMGVLWIVARATAEPDGEKDAPFAVDDETPLGDTNEHSDAIDDRKAA
ncbi:MAG TPA: hypothetical protein VF715_08985 [Thermoleophilaceae bacterium]